MSVSVARGASGRRHRRRHPAAMRRQEDMAALLARCYAGMPPELLFLDDGLITMLV